MSSYYEKVGKTKGLYEGIEMGEWSFLEVPECVKAIELGARRAFMEVGNPPMDSLEDYTQDAYLYAATHPATVSGYRTGVALSEHIRQRVIQDSRPRRDMDDRTESYEAMLEDRESDL